MNIFVSIALWLMLQVTALILWPTTLISWSWWLIFMPTWTAILIWLAATCLDSRDSSGGGDWFFFVGDMDLDGCGGGCDHSGGYDD